MLALVVRGEGFNLEVLREARYALRLQVVMSILKASRQNHNVKF